MSVSSNSICVVCNEGKSGYNAVVLPCGHVSCANCIVNSEREDRIECNICPETLNSETSQPRARQAFVESVGATHIQAQIIALERSLDEEKRARVEFESDLLRQLLQISIKEGEKNQREVETLRAEIGVMKDAISMYSQELDEMCKKYAAVEQKCVDLEKEMRATKAQGDKEISYFQKALKQESQCADASNSDGFSAESTSRDVKVEANSQTIDAPRTAPRGATIPAPAIKTEGIQVAPKLVVREIGLGSREAVVFGGGSEYVFKGIGPMNIVEAKTGTDTDSETGIDVKPSSERSVLPLRARKTPRVNLPGSSLSKVPSVPATPAPTKPEATAHLRSPS